MNQLKRIREAFADQSKGFGDSALTLARQDYLRWMLEVLPGEPHYDVLDVAAGTAHLSRTLAPFVHHVTALDATPEMLAEGEREAAKAGLHNISFTTGNAAALPFNQGAFDLVVSRFAVHHFSEPSVQLAEMVRVCKPGGYVGIIDIVSPSDSNLAQAYNHWEQKRDPSHTTALAPEPLVDLISRAGLNVTTLDSREVEVDVDKWLNLTSPGEQVVQEIKQAIKQEIAGKGATGLRPFVRDQAYKFWQTWTIVIGKIENT